MKKTIFFVALLALLNCFGTGNAEDVCELAAAMEKDGVRITIKNYRGRSTDGQGLLKDVENSDFDPVTYYIHARCNLDQIANLMVYVEANYDRMRKVGEMVSFNGELESSTGWGEFLGSHEPYIQLTLKSGRISWAD